MRAKVAFLPPEHVLLASPADAVGGGGGRCASFQAPQDRVAASICTLRRTTLPLLPSGSVRPERHTPQPKEIRLQAKRPPSPHRGRQEFLRGRHRVRLVPRGASAAAPPRPLPSSARRASLLLLALAPSARRLAGRGGQGHCCSPSTKHLPPPLPPFFLLSNWKARKFHTHAHTRTHPHKPLVRATSEASSFCRGGGDRGGEGKGEEGGKRFRNQSFYTNWKESSVGRNDSLQRKKEKGGFLPQKKQNI